MAIINHAKLFSSVSAAQKYKDKLLSGWQPLAVNGYNIEFLGDITIEKSEERPGWILYFQYKKRKISNTA